MSNTYNWIISALKCYPQYESQTDVVFSVDWRRTAVNGSCSAYIFDTQLITFKPGQPFKPYATVTEADVISWLEEAMGADVLAEQIANLDKQIEEQTNPPVVSPPLPWMAG